MERQQFTFYVSFFNAISRIRKKAARADAYDAICAYALLGIEPDLGTMEDAAASVFEMAKPNLDASRRKAESGAKGGNGKQNGSKTEANEEQTASKNKDKNKNKIKNKNKCYITRETRDTAFDTFWVAYPRKVGKDAARKAFAKVEVPVETLVAALERQRCSTQWTEEGGRFIPNPSTWLNQGRCEDELPASKKTAYGCSGLTEADYEAIQRLMAEG